MVCVSRLHQPHLLMTQPRCYIPALREGRLPLSAAGAVPRNTMQSQSQETLFFRDTLFPPFLPFCGCCCHILEEFISLLAQNQLFCSKRREVWAKIPPTPSTESIITRLSCFLTLHLCLRKSKEKHTQVQKELARAFPFLCTLSVSQSMPERMRKEKQKWNLTPVHLQDTLLSPPCSTDVCERN